MPRSIIPHGNRRRVPAGFGRQSPADAHGPARAASALNAGDAPAATSNGNRTNTPSHNNRTSNHPSGATPDRNNTPALNTSQHLSSRYTGGEALCRASEQSLESSQPHHHSNPRTPNILPAQSPVKAMSPSGAPPYPPSGRGNSQTGHPQSKGAGSAMAQSRFASTPAGLSPGVKVSQDYRNSGSLLGQSYQAPSTEKFAKKPAVKVVRSDMAKPIIDEHAILKPQIENAVVEKPVVQSPVGQNPVVQKSVIQQPMTQKPVIKKPVTQMPVIEMPDIPKPVIQRTVIEMPNVQKSVVEKPARLDVQKPKLDAPLNVAKSSPLDYAVKPTAQDYAVKPVEKPEGKENTASSLQKLDKHHGTPQPRSEQKAAIAITHEDVERFTDPTGRRICLASIPPGTRQSDVCDMIVGMANAKISIENVAVFNFPGEPRPNYALVETESEKEAGRIASWVDRERLFGWPISARVVRSMTKGRLSSE
ncbi:uncharacterized protein BKA78DRAFT_60395 [Phyllosticta capitalensis]|uniref:uncharacterized protein n=1 Tax=Phyllosticta capitalensis TaxID=121624 RepID=UPI00313040EF